MSQFVLGAPALADRTGDAEGGEGTDQDEGGPQDPSSVGSADEGDAAAVDEVVTLEEGVGPGSVEATEGLLPSGVETVAEALAVAAATGERVVVDGLRDGSTTVWADPEGTLTAELYAGVEQVEDPEGRWRRVDPRLVSSEGEGGGLVPRVGAAEVVLSGGGGSELASVATPEGDRGLGLGFAGVRLPAPEVEGTVARYRDVSPGVDVELEALPAGFAKRIVLRERPEAAVVWRFPLRLTGLEVEATETGGLRLVDGEGVEVAAADSMWMWGAEIDETSGEPVRVAEVDVRLVRERGVPIVEVRPDPAFLADPEVVFPVTVDPSTTLTASADTWVQSNIRNTSQWSSTELRAGTYDGSTRARSFLRFNTSVVEGSEVTDARLRLWNWHSWSCQARQVEVRRLTSGFNSSTVWDTQTGQTSTVFGTASFAHGYSSACPSAWGEIQVRSLVQWWADGGTNHGLAVRASNESDTFGWKKFNSTSASSNRPRLAVTYETPPEGPSGVDGTPEWHLRNGFSGTTDRVFVYGESGDVVVTGDWNGDGRTGVGIFRPGGRWELRNGFSGPADHTFTYGRQEGDIPVVSDWNGDGRDGVGIFRSGGEWHLRNGFSGATDHIFTYGQQGDIPVTGDWNGDSRSGVGIFRSGGEWHLRNGFSGSTDHIFTYGRQQGDIPVTGDWNGDSRSGVGIFRSGGEWHLRNGFSGSTDHTFTYGRQQGDIPVVGDWNRDGVDGVGIVRGADPDAPRQPRLDAPVDGWRGTHRPELVATNRADRTVDLRFSVFDEDGTRVARRTVTGVAPGGQATWTPGSAVGAGWWEWTAQAIDGTSSPQAAPRYFQYSPGDADAPGAGDRGYYRFLDHDLTDTTRLRVNVANGNVMIQTPDLEVAGVAGHDLGWVRTYNSGGIDAARAAGGGWVAGPGRDVGIYHTDDGAVVYEAPDGARMRFTAGAEAGTWEAPSGLRATLSGDGPYQLRFRDSGERFEFDAAGWLTAHVDRSGNEISYSYRDRRLVTVTDTRGRDLDISYGGDGRIDAVTDVSGRSVGYDHDSDGRLTAVSAADGTTMSFDYDGEGRVSVVTDPRGVATSLDYDTQGRLVQLVRNAGGPGDSPVWSFDYQAATEEDRDDTVISDPRGNDTTYRHDGMGRVRTVIDAHGNERTTDYDDDSNVVAYTANAPGGTQGPQVTLTYDEDSGNLTGVEQPSGATAAFSYDDDNNPDAPSGYTSPQGSGVDYTYDEGGRLRSVIPRSDAGGAGYRVSYNSDGTVDFTEAPNGTATTYHYDSDGHLTRIDHPDPRGSTTFTYDDLSRVESRTDPDGRTTTYVYDEAARIVQQRYDDGRHIDFDYDDNGNRTEVDDQASADTTTTTYHYDNLNRLEHEQRPTGTNTYGYDPASNLTALADLGGQTTYSYDAVNLPTTITTPDGQSIELEHDTDGRRTEIAYPNGVVQYEEHNDDGNLTRIRAHNGAGQSITDLRYHYTHPDSGAATNTRYQVVDGVEGTTTDYRYDDHDRLTSAETTDSDTSELIDRYTYSYDVNSNLDEHTINDQTTTYTFNDADQLTADSDGRSYSYDTTGNLTTISSDGTTLTGYSYDTRGRLTAIDDTDDGQTTFGYHGADQTGRTHLNASRHHPTVVGITTISPDPAANLEPHHYTRAPDGTILAARTTTAPAGHYYLHDGLGSTAAITDATGQTTNRYSYDPYGATTEQREPGAIDNPWRYTGEHHDPTGHYHIGHRYYQPTPGRWTQPDPLERAANPLQPPEVNPYAYVGCNPTNHTDPTGLSASLEAWIGYLGWRLALAAFCGGIGGAASLLMSPIGGGYVWAGCMLAGLVLEELVILPRLEANWG